MPLSKVKVVREIIANTVMGVGVLRKWRVRRGRTSVSLDLQVEKILRQFEFFVSVVGKEWIKGKVVAEIGPGDSLAHGLLFAAAGAARYIAIDRFVGNYTGATAVNVYKELIERAPQWIKEGLIERNLSVNTYPWTADSGSAKIIGIYGHAIEEVNDQSGQSIDLIVSYNVIEHLKNIELAIEKMSNLLVPHGLMVHRVDYGPHGIFQECINPLEFLTLSDVVWNAMGGNRGFPNRVRHPELLDALRNSGFEVTTLGLGHFSKKVLEDIKPQLIGTSRDYSDDALLVADAEIFAEYSGSARALRNPCP
jgi:hypothetical protein